MMYEKTYFSNEVSMVRVESKQVQCCSHWLLLALLTALLLTGCLGGQGASVKADQAVFAQDYDRAVSEYLEAIENDPGNNGYRMKLIYVRGQAALKHKGKADTLFAQEHYAAAMSEYKLALELDPSLFAAADGLKKTQGYYRAQINVADAETLLEKGQSARAGELITQVLKQLPNYQPALDLDVRIKQTLYALVDGIALDVTSTEPIDLNFNRTELPDVFKVLTRLSGINFILDEDIRDKKTTFYLENATFAQSLELLLQMNTLDKKVLNSKTIILYPKTRDKQKQYKDQIIQTFYLSNMDAKSAQSMVRTMLSVRKAYVQEDLNALVIRDEPDIIRLAQKLIEANDRGDSEVLFDLELVEVNYSDSSELGLKLGTYSVGLGVGLDGSGEIVDSAIDTATDNMVSFTNGLSDLDSFYTLPSATFNFTKTLVSSDILANPKIRVKNKSKAKVQVGTQEPVITVTTDDGVTSDSVSYVDVGVTLEVEPVIQLDDTIVTTLSLEVSSVSSRETTSNGTAVITISSTSADTTLTLKDGEQTVIGGLIRNNDSVTRNVMPLLGQIPLIGNLFNAKESTDSKREILLSVTPHIVKSVRVPTGEAASIWSGGEDDIKYGRNFGTFADELHAGQSLPLSAESSQGQIDVEKEIEKSDKSEKPLRKVNSAMSSSDEASASDDDLIPEASDLTEDTVIEEVVEEDQALQAE
jgi:general secretion pathway protein D